MAGGRARTQCVGGGALLLLLFPVRGGAQLYRRTSRGARRQTDRRETDGLNAVRTAARAMVPLLLTACLLLLGGARADLSDPVLFTSPSEFTFGSSAVLFCNVTLPPSNITGHKWIKGDKTLREDDSNDISTTYNVSQVNSDTSGVYTCHFKTDPPVSGTIEVAVSPHVVAYKPSEHGNEGDVGVMTCKSKSYPPVENWNWYKVMDGANEPILNGTGDRYHIKSNGTKSELRISALSMETDPGTYICNGTNLLGSGGATVSLRVRSRLAALWPFLGIVVEVLILVTIIFIYEKRRKPDEVPDEDDGGAAPLKSNSGTNHEDNVRQRNSN